MSDSKTTILTVMRRDGTRLAASVDAETQDLAARLGIDIEALALVKASEILEGIKRDR